MHLQPTNSQPRCPKHTLKKGQPLQQMVLGQLDIHMQDTKIVALFITLYKNKLKMDQRSEPLKPLDVNTGEILQDICGSIVFLHRTQKHRKKKQKLRNGIATN
jgi:hypothetical protein